jgi:hypothetical protein
MRCLAYTKTGSLPESCCGGNWVPSADTQKSLWEKVANRISAEEVVYVVPPDMIERLQSHDKKSAVPPKKVSSSQ